MARALCSVLYKKQKEANSAYDQRVACEQEKKPRDRGVVSRARGYYVTSLTIEGLRTDVSGHGLPFTTES